MQDVTLKDQRGGLTLSNLRDLPNQGSRVLTTESTKIKKKQAVRVATQYPPARCTPVAAAQLQPIPHACGAQRALLPIAVGAINIDQLYSPSGRQIQRNEYTGK